MNADPRLTFTQAQAYLAQAHGVRLTLGTLRQYRNSGIGPPFVRIGGRLQITTAALDRWVDERTTRRESLALHCWQNRLYSLTAQVIELRASRATRYTWQDLQAIARERGLVL